jgi:hypothetical protein
MGTINALCLPSLSEFLYNLMKLKEKYGRDSLSFTLNILRFPSFQSPLILPVELRTKYSLELEKFLSNNKKNTVLHEHELEHIKRLIEYLTMVDTPHSEAFDLPTLQNDFKQFYQQYDQRRGKDFKYTFTQLINWYETL